MRHDSAVCPSWAFPPKTHGRCGSRHGGLLLGHLGEPCRAYAARLATLAIVARLQPVAACIDVPDMPKRSMPAIPALRSVSSGRPR